MTDLHDSAGAGSWAPPPARPWPPRPPPPRSPYRRAAAAPRRREPDGPTATFRWLGTAGWRIDIGDRTVLVDPYLSRFDTGLFDGSFDPGTALSVDVTRIADHPGAPETILVTHTHWDHYNDVPHIAAQSGARVFGTLTAYHLGLAHGLPAAQLSPVKGGEVLDFGDYTVEVVSSLHSRNGSYSMAFPGRARRRAGAAGDDRRPARGRHPRLPGDPARRAVGVLHGRERLRRAQPHRARPRRRDDRGAEHRLHPRLRAAPAGRTRPARPRSCRCTGTTSRRR